jgi:hypothetical protein
MLVMQHPVFRRFWYPTVALSALAAGPRPFTLLGQPLVLWLGKDGAPHAFHDRCPHRGVALSMDSKVVDGALRCGYHGWRFGPGGPPSNSGLKIVVSRAYGLSFGCLSSTHRAPYRIVDPNSCPAPRCRAERLSPAVAAPGSCLPGAPIVWDTRPLMGTTQGVAPGLWQGSAACTYNEKF